MHVAKCRGVAALQQNCSSSDASSPLFGAGTVAYLSPGESAVGGEGVAAQLL